MMKNAAQWAEESHAMQAGADGRYITADNIRRVSQGHLAAWELSCAEVLIDLVRHDHSRMDRPDYAITGLCKLARRDFAVMGVYFID